MLINLSTFLGLLFSLLFGLKKEKRRPFHPDSKNSMVMDVMDRIGGVGRKRQSLSSFFVMNLVHYRTLFMGQTICGWELVEIAGEID